MKIVKDKIIAEKGNVIRRIGENCQGYGQCYLLDGETEASFEESSNFEIVDVNNNYEERVNELIRQRYSESQEFAILRQRQSKPQEFKAYNDYCEECKAKAKAELTKA